MLVFSKEMGNIFVAPQQRGGCPANIFTWIHSNGNTLFTQFTIVSLFFLPKKWQFFVFLFRNTFVYSISLSHPLNFYYKIHFFFCRDTKSTFLFFYKFYSIFQNDSQIPWKMLKFLICSQFRRVGLQVNRK